MSWSSKKQTSVALSTAEAEYVAAGQCCAQLLWMRQTLRDFGYNLSKVPLLCDNESATRIAENPVEHSRTKHIDIRHHFLRDHQQKGDIEVFYVSTAELKRQQQEYLPIQGNKVLYVQYISDS